MEQQSPANNANALTGTEDATSEGQSKHARPLAARQQPDRTQRADQMVDIIVIGGGHNGLAAACYLAQGGHSVLVVEANETIGGMSTTRALVPTAPKHLLDPGGIDFIGAASPLGRDLDLARFGLRLIDHDPAWAWLGPNGESILMARDVRRTIAEIERFSAKDASTYREYAELTAKLQEIRGGTSRGATLLAAVRGLGDRRVRRLLGAVVTTPAAELIESTFVSAAVRGMFASILWLYGSLTEDGSGIIFLAATAALHRHGVGRPAGGMQAIPDSLSRCLQAHGGSVRVSSPVAEILLSGGRVRGVRLADGEKLTARAVIAAIPPQVTAGLLASSDVPGLEALARAPANSSGLAPLVVVMALRGKLTLGKHQRSRTDVMDLRKPTLFCGTLEQVLAADSAARAGRVVQDPPWAGTISSATDPTVAPDGQDTLYLCTPAPVWPKSGWADAGLAAESELICAAEKVMPGISELEIGRWTQTPKDLEQRLGAKNGCIYHVDMTLTRLGPLRPARGWGKHVTSIPGLILSGAGTQPGGGVSGIPGKMAAQELMRWMRKEG